VNRFLPLLAGLLGVVPALGGCGGGTAGADAGDGDERDAADAPAEGGDGEDAEAGSDVPGEGGDDAAGDAEAADDGGIDAVSCDRTTDPLDLWIEREEVDLTGGGPFTFLGRIEGPCGVDGRRVVASRGMRVRFEANAEAGTHLTARLALYEASALSSGSGTPIAEAVGAPGFTAILEAPIARSGEYLLLTHDLELADPGRYSLFGRCIAGCGVEATRFPIVLMHGFGGWGTILGFLEYFYGVKDHLEERGYDVHAPIADAVNDTAARARQYAVQIDEILRTTGARKVSLVCHSQGGLDARHLISVMGYADRVGGVVMVSTPNRGTLVADAMVGDLPVASTLLSALFDLWGSILGGSEADTRAAFAQLTTARLAEFNAVHPDAPGVRYWSWAGRSCGTLDFSCQRDNHGEIIDPLLLISFEFLSGDEPGHGPNDGLVPVDSARWGTFLGTIPGDHWDEIGQLADGGPSGAFDHLEFYLGIARMLHAAGL
jgi:triacylglycerol lipase